MLSLGKLAPGGHEYYVEVVAQGAEEYYVSAREAPGQWIGNASGRLDLDGEVEAEVLERILRHADPSGAYRLTAAHSVPTVAAYDATFCAPKSVSLLFALGSPEVSNEVRNAQDASVGAAFDVLQRVACRGRRGKGGLTLVDGDGFVAAAFRHRTSRAADPHLHTHVLIANLVHAPIDDRWTALDGRPIFSWLQTAGFLYDAQLRWELFRRVGVEWGPVGKTGTAEIAGVPQAAIREFSTRRKEIEAHIDEHVGASPQIATYATRRAKDPELDPNSLLPAWRERAARSGLDPEALDAVLARNIDVDPPAVGSMEAELLYQWMAGPHGLTAKASTFGDREVLKAICSSLPGGAPVDHVLQLADGFLRSPHVVGLQGSVTGDVIRRTDGVIVAAHTDETRWTTPEMLEVERRLLATSERRRGSGAGVARDDAIEAAVGERTLGAEQEAMVRRVCSSGDGVELVVGVAGSGKTYALAAARDAWHRSGFTVIGCSLAARAAKQLQDDAGIPSATLTRVLNDIERHRLPVDATTVLVVDEAGMVGTRALDRLVNLATGARAKVVLVGDPFQLPEIDAGGAFRGLRTRLGAAELTENRRQTEPWEPAALEHLRNGDPDQALDTYIEHERVHTASSDDAVRQDIVNAWMRQYFAGEDVLMVAARLADVDDLNRRTRAVLRQRYCLGPDEIVLAGRPYATGDEVLALRNDYATGLLNGTRAEIQQIDLERQQLSLRTSAGTDLTVPLAYADTGNLTHGYATTIHKAQGATVDRCLVLLDDTTSREHAYTALSRGRHGNDLFVVAPDRRVDERHAPELDADLLARLRRALTHSVAKDLAVDQVRPPLTPLQQLRSERDLLATSLRSRPLDPSVEYQHAQHTLDSERRLSDALAVGLADAHRQHDEFGPIRRRTHADQYRALEARITDLAKQIDGHDRNVDKLRVQLGELEPRLTIYREWCIEHRHDLDRLETVERSIRITERLDIVQERAVQRGQSRELDFGIEL